MSLAHLYIGQRFEVAELINPPLVPLKMYSKKRRVFIQSFPKNMNIFRLEVILREVQVDEDFIHGKGTAPLIGWLGVFFEGAKLLHLAIIIAIMRYALRVEIELFEALRDLALLISV